MMDFAIKSRRYFDTQSKEESKPIKYLDLVVFEGAIPQEEIDQIVNYFVKKFKKKSNRKVFKLKPPQIPTDLKQQLKHPMQIFATMCQLISRWSTNVIKQDLTHEAIVVLNQYYHRYEASAFLMGAEIAHQKRAKQMQILADRGEKVPKDLPPLEISFKLINELRKYTDEIRKPDVMFAIFDYSNPKTAQVKWAFDELFNTEPYFYPINSFYGIDTVIKEIEVRLKSFTFLG